MSERDNTVRTDTIAKLRAEQLAAASNGQSEQPLVRDLRFTKSGEPRFARRENTTEGEPSKPSLG